MPRMTRNETANTISALADGLEGDHDWLSDQSQTLALNLAVDAICDLLVMDYPQWGRLAITEDDYQGSPWDVADDGSYASQTRKREWAEVVRDCAQAWKELDTMMFDRPGCRRPAIECPEDAEDAREWQEAREEWQAWDDGEAARAATIAEWGDLACRASAEYDQEGAGVRCHYALAAESLRAAADHIIAGEMGAAEADIDEASGIVGAYSGNATPEQCRNALRLLAALTAPRQCECQCGCHDEAEGECEGSIRLCEGCQTYVNDTNGQPVCQCRPEYAALTAETEG